ncbi:MAG TPA: hypothetical protein IAC72_03195 [Candidatus Fimimonas merdipullorum]|uniref:Uncharacterized protein n=1 Tax=Candidatus Fimimonas merdipullorum TaxID=2840822 RepID=A0A9D1MXF9_9BACT|nr:hypothetical protein [Candidatus Fimimonas merdipullorum]
MAQKATQKKVVSAYRKGHLKKPCLFSAHLSPKTNNGGENFAPPLVKSHFSHAVKRLRQKVYARAVEEYPCRTNGGLKSKTTYKRRVEIKDDVLLNACTKG